MGLTLDPDTRVSARLTDRLATEAGANGVRLSASVAVVLAQALIREFITARSAEWSVGRKAPFVGKPDPESVGFAEAALPAIADGAGELGLPLDVPIGSWSKAQVAVLFAIAHDQVREQAARTLEMPISEEIPF
jgi:hypothetical protein